MNFQNRQISSFLSKADIALMANDCLSLLNDLLMSPQRSRDHVADRLSQMDAECLEIFQEEFRQRFNSTISTSWSRLTPNKLGNDWVVWALASFHANGYIREQAVKNLSTLDKIVFFLFYFCV